jgi:hypothetical protein
MLRSTALEEYLLCPTGILAHDRRAYNTSPNLSHDSAGTRIKPTLDFVFRELITF